PVEAGRMATEVQGLTGLHDFGAFCKPRPGATTIRTLHNFELETIGELVIVHLAADAFCHHMIRDLVGALLQVGDGTMPPGWLRDRLFHPVIDSHMVLAPAHGLILHAVYYPDDGALGQRARQTRPKPDEQRIVHD